ncbi:hypothetical protein ACYPKM_02080 [Pseudomonas aeruginosa]
MSRYYHVTLASNLEEIRRFGLIPQVGIRAAYLLETTPGIHCFTSEASIAENMEGDFGQLFSNISDSNLVIIEIEMPPEIEPQAGKIGVFFTDRIGAEYIVEYTDVYRQNYQTSASPGLPQSPSWKFAEKLRAILDEVEECDVLTQAEAISVLAMTSGEIAKRIDRIADKAFAEP